MNPQLLVILVGLFYILIIGGLLQQREEKDRGKVPILGDIPLLGKYLFSNEALEAENLELVILIKPKIIQSEGFFAERVKQ